jgi:hypothetical protein
MEMHQETYYLNIFFKKDLIFTEAVGAIQELYKMYTQLKQEFEDYKQSHS